MSAPLKESVEQDIGTKGKADGSISQVEAEFVLSGSKNPARMRFAALLENGIYFSILSLILLTAIPYGATGPWWEAAFECAVFALGLLCVSQVWVSGDWRIEGRSLLAPILGLILLSYLQTLPFLKADGESDILREISADPYETRLVTFKLLALTVMGLLLFRYTSSRSRLHVLVNVIIVLGVASALFGITRAVAQREAPGFLLPGLEPRVGYGQFINRNHFAFLMEMALGLVFGLIAGGGLRSGRWLIYVAAGVPIWAALVLSNSRGGILSMLCQVLVAALFFNTARFGREVGLEGRGASKRILHLSNSPAVKGLLILAVVALVSISIVWVGGDPLVSRIDDGQSGLDQTLSYTNEGRDRTQIWRATWLLVKDNPIVGVGLGGYWAAIAEYHNASGISTPQQAHNDYLELLASGGVVGAALGLWFAVVCVWQARRQLGSIDPFRRSACLGAVIGMFGVAVHSIVDFGLHITINALIFTTLIVIATADAATTSGRSR